MFILLLFIYKKNITLYYTLFKIIHFLTKTLSDVIKFLYDISNLNLHRILLLNIRQKDNSVNLPRIRAASYRAPVLPSKITRKIRQSGTTSPRIRFTTSRGRVVSESARSTTSLTCYKLIYDHLCKFTEKFRSKSIPFRLIFVSSSIDTIDHDSKNGN